MNGSILAIGCSATGWDYIPNLEVDALFVADCYERSYKLFPRFDDYPIAKWEANIITGQVLDYRHVLTEIEQMPRAKRMTIYVSAHGFTHKIKGKKHLCVYLGDANNWVPAEAIINRAYAISLEKGVDHVQLVFDTCYSGLTKADFYKLSKHTPMFNATKPMLIPKAINVEPNNVNIDLNFKGKLKAHNKFGVINVCKGKQTSFAKISPDMYVLASTNGYSLGTAAIYTAANFYYSYAPGLNIKVNGVMCKPRSNKAILTLAQRRITSIIKSIGLYEWLKSEPRTHIQIINTAGKIILY